jgi:hypothetical protein
VGEGKIGSWLPVIIEGKADGHVHGLIWWEWDRPWSERLLPEGVRLLGLGGGLPGEAKCDVCRIWGRPGGVGAAVHPPGPLPAHVGDRREELLATAGAGKKPEKAVARVESPEKVREAVKASPIDDF